MRTAIDKRKREAALIGAAISCGGRKRGPEEGPKVLLSTGLHFPMADIIEANESTLECCAFDVVTEFSHRLQACVERVVREGSFPVVVGGDHSIGIGTWTGVAQGLRIQENMGLIWIDAHMDAHTPETSPSSAIHGMPLAVLLGYGDDRLLAIGKHRTIRPESLVLVGIRSYEEGEHQLLKDLGVRIYFMEEVLSRGFRNIMTEAVERASRGTAGFGLSLDLDAFDPMEAPAVHTRVTNGLAASEVLPVLTELAENPLLLGLEIAEFCPKLDSSNRDTMRLLKQLLEATIAPIQAAKKRMGACHG